VDYDTACGSGRDSVFAGDRLGLPGADAPGNISAWGLDEIGPIGPLKQLAGWQGAIKGAPQDPADPQYPLFHYIVVASFDVSYCQS
jgi:hypothetical protein